MEKKDILLAAATILAGMQRSYYPELDIQKAVDEAIALAKEIKNRFE